MPNINLTDSRKRDAVVKAENIGVDEDIRYVDTDGNNAYTRKILKATVDHDYDTLIKNYSDDPEKLALAIVDGDPEVDMEKCGLFLWGVSKVYVNSDDGIVYRIEQTEIVRDAHGEVKERRPRRRTESNVDSDIPLTWTGKQIDKGEALRKYVFASKLQIVHVNGLTYDFLFGMASELAKNNSLMIVGGGQKGRDPLIFRSGSIPYRGFLEGRVDGDKYILLLHLSNMELKLPSEKPSVAKQKSEESDNTSKPKSTSAKKETAEKETDSSEEKEAATTVKKAKKDAVEAVEGEKQGETEQKSATKKDLSKEGTAQKDTGKEDTGKKATAKKETREKEALEKEAPPEKQKNKSVKKQSSTKKQQEKKSDEESQSETGKEKKAAKADSGKGSSKDKKDKVAEPPVEKTVTPESVTSEDLGVWLKSVRMGKYLQLFIDNEIDVDVLPELTDEDLKELEIPVGSRRRLLKAVAETEDLRAEVSMTVRKLAKAGKT
jgi:hypothetical protein